MADTLLQQLQSVEPAPSSSPSQESKRSDGGEKASSTPATQNAPSAGQTQAQQQLPKGVVLGPDGKPCRSCTSAAAWRALMKQSKGDTTSTSTTTTPASTSTPAKPTLPPSAPTLPPPDCPPDVEQLGRSSWTLLHTMAATYPDTADSTKQSDMAGFLRLFTKLYPCWVCGSGFQAWMGKNPPPLGGRREFGDWMCRAHNVVNRRLGKEEFDCRFWEERWRDGWRDGRCE